VGSFGGSSYLSHIRISPSSRFRLKAAFKRRFRFLHVASARSGSGFATGAGLGQRASTARLIPPSLSLPRPAPSSVSSGDLRALRKSGGCERDGGLVIYNEDQTPNTGTGLFPVLYCFFSETPPTARPLRDAPPVAGLRRESERYGSRPSKLELQKLWPIQQDRSCREWDCPVRLL
jgi:hypothetical protein